MRYMLHEVHTHEVHAHEVHARDIHAREVHACEVHTHEVYGNFDFREWFCDFVVLEISILAIVRYGPNLPPYRQASCH